ncbi:hypothetical protein HY971_04455 [Candidatus Kaiserbacteria bacterium]|nr:hypothetical protein [Candidatus Kaiserbacteria bacterium]
MDEMLRQKPRDERPRELSREPWDRYAELRAKGEDSELSPQDFRQVIECEMLLSTVDNPPFGEVFDAEVELKKITSLPHGKKETALEVFKDKLVRQRHAYAQCRSFIERAIQYDPDTKGAGLIQIGDFFANRYGFSDFAKGTLYDLIGEYADQHKAVKAFRLKYPDNATLVREVTGVPVNPADIRVTEGPLSIDIQTDRATAERLYSEDGKLLIDGTAQKMGSETQAFQARNPENNICFTVAVNNIADLENAYTHEQQHVRNQVFRKFFDLPKTLATNASIIQTRVRNEPDSVVRSGLRVEELRAVRDQALDEVKDELTAMLKDKKSQYFNRFYSKDGGPYDYLVSKRDEYYKDPDYAELAHEILVGEYDRIITDALKAFNDLRTAGKYDADKAVALLTDMPLDRWPSTVYHLNQHAYKYKP